MKNLFKGKIATAIILLSTFVLAGVAIFTAIRLYQLRQTAVAPNVPSSIPKAQEVELEAPCGFDERTGQNVSCAEGFVCVQPEVSIPGMGVCRTSGTPLGNCGLGFTFATPSPTATAIATATATATSTATATATATATSTATATAIPTGTPNNCGGTCGSNLNCGNGLICYSGYCRNPSCTSNTDCVCSTAGPTATATVKPATNSTTTPAPTQPALPQSGTDWPTVLGIGIGILTIVGSLLLAL